MSDSGDAQVVSSNFVADVQSALQITTGAPASQCGTGHPAARPRVEPRHVDQRVPDGRLLQRGHRREHLHARARGLHRGSLEHAPTSRRPCPSTSTANLSPPTIYPPDGEHARSAGWVSAQPVTNVQFTVTEPEQGRVHLRLSAMPAIELAAEHRGQSHRRGVPTPPAASHRPRAARSLQRHLRARRCASSTSPSYNATDAAYPNCQTFVAVIPGGDTLSFCMSESGQPADVRRAAADLSRGVPRQHARRTAAATPCPSTPASVVRDCTPPETGSRAPDAVVHRRAAMYQTDSGFGPTNTLTFTDISVTTATGAPATGWEFVSADAETTDTNEYITWTSNEVLRPPDSVCRRGPPDGLTAGPLRRHLRQPAELERPPGLRHRHGDLPVRQPGDLGHQDRHADRRGAHADPMSISMKGAGLEGIAVGLQAVMSPPITRPRRVRDAPAPLACGSGAWRRHPRAG